MKLFQFILTSLFAAKGLADSKEIYSLNFFAKLNDTLIPLSATQYFSKGKEVNVLVYEERPVSPTNFTLIEGKAVTNETSTPGPVGLDIDSLVITPNNNATTWVLDDKDGRILNDVFYACDYSNNTKRYIRYGDIFKNSTKCDKVDIFLLQPDKPVHPTIIPEYEVNSPYPSSLNTPHVFVAKFNNTYQTISGYSYERKGVRVSILSYEISPAVAVPPLNFTLQDNYAISQAKLIPGKVSFTDGVMSFGHGIRPEILNLDPEMKIVNGPFQSCEIIGTGRSGIFRKLGFFNTTNCVNAEIYFWPYEKAMASVSKNVPKVKDNQVLLGEEETLLGEEKTLLGEEETLLTEKKNEIEELDQIPFPEPQ